jgi:hypothetical protein
MYFIRLSIIILRSLIYLIIFLFSWLKNATCSSRILVHVVTTETSSFFNQYFNWSRFWIWYDVEIASDSSSISSVEMIDSRRVFLIDRFDDSVSTDCILLETNFSCIMIALSADDLCRYDSNWCSLDARFFSWLIQDNVIEILLQMIGRVLNNNDVLRVLYRLEIARVIEVNIMSRTSIK